MRLTKTKIGLAITFISSSLSAPRALAQTLPTLLGGGSTLVLPVIVSEMMIFPAADATIAYFGASSGAGQSAFLNNDSAQLDADLHATVIFANSDATLSATQITAYQHGRAKIDGARSHISSRQSRFRL